MSTVISPSDLLRRAAAWIESELVHRPGTALHVLLDEAGMRYNLGPQEFLMLEKLFRGTEKRKPS